MRLLVTGGRDYLDREAVRLALSEIHPLPEILIHGAARGADTLAADEAKKLGIPRKPYPANWRPNGILDYGAGHKRNQQMIDEGKPTHLLAFPGGTGTADMTRRCVKAGIPVRRVSSQQETIEIKCKK